VFKLKIPKRKPFLSKDKCYYNHIKEYKVERPGSDTIIRLIKSLANEIRMFLDSLLRGDKRLPKNEKAWQAKPDLSLKNINNITWIGHSTFLINLNNKNILTDPIFGNATLLFPRILKPGISLSNLPKIDYVLISHNHWDHMDYSSIKYLKNNFPDIKYLVPAGDAKYLLKWGFKKENISEGQWWKDYAFAKDKLKFHFLPAYHWSQRTLFDKNRSLWGSWMIENLDTNNPNNINSRYIYFGGDTAYANHFKDIANKFKNIDLALLPIGPCEPRKFLYTTHINAEEAGKALLDLKAKSLIPMHWGTFHFGSDHFNTPIKQIHNWWQDHKKLLNKEQITLNILKIGETLKLNNLNLNNNLKFIEKTL